MARVLTSAYLDTNVYVAASAAGALHPPSYRLVRLAADRRLGAVGSVLLRRELQGVCRGLGSRLPLDLYELAIILELPGGRRDRCLGKLYQRALGIKPNDALHLAYAVGVGVDAFVSWNREDLVKRTTRVRLQAENDRLGRATPIIITPADLLKAAGVQGRRGRLSLR